MSAPTPTPNAMPGATPPSAPPEPAAAPPAAPTPAAPPNGATPPSAPSEPDNRPPWERSGEKFDPQRAWNLIQNAKAAEKTARDDLTAYKQDTDPIVAEREQLRRASQTDLDRANEDLTKAHAASETWRTHAIRSKAEALAAGQFIDAETAVALIGDMTQFVTGDEIDVPKLAARLDQLAADKPFLVATPAAPPGFAPNRAQGQSGTGGATSLDEQIKAAEKSGDLSLSIALKQQKHAQLRK